MTIRPKSHIKKILAEFTSRGMVKQRENLMTPWLNILLQLGYVKDDLKCLIREYPEKEKKIAKGAQGLCKNSISRG